MKTVHDATIKWMYTKCVALGIVLFMCCQSVFADNADLSLNETSPLDEDEIAVSDDTTPSLLLSGGVNLSLFGNDQEDAFFGSSEIWNKNWGISAQLLKNDTSSILGLPEDTEYFNLDVKRRFGRKDRSNFELGLGWQELDINSQLDASGPKFSLSGKLNVLDSFKVYGSTAYFPELEDNLQNNKITGYELEAGLLYSPIPSLSLKAGYKVFNLDLNEPEIEGLGSTSGFLLGTDLSW